MTRSRHASPTAHARRLHRARYPLRHEPVTDLSALRWAVALGCTTAPRLAREWEISVPSARQRLLCGEFEGVLAVDRRSTPLTYRPINDPTAA